MGCKYSTFKCNFSATSKDLLCEEIQILWSNTKYGLFFPRMEHDSIGMIWKAFQFQGDAIWCSLKQSDVLSLAITFSCDSRSHPNIHLSILSPRCHLKPPICAFWLRTSGLPSLFSEIFSGPLGVMTSLSVLQAPSILPPDFLHFITYVLPQPSPWAWKQISFSPFCLS